MAKNLTRIQNSKKELKLIDLEKLRPTQLACGWQEVEAKEWEMLNIKRDKLLSYLKKKTIPVVAGPNGKMYLIDRHHMGLALLHLADRWDWEEKNSNEGSTNPYQHCFVKVVLDYSKTQMTKMEFFQKLEEEGMLHPYDQNGKRVEIIDIPTSLADLKNDPYRALAGFARKSGAYTKSTMPYAEFKWADYFREKIPANFIKSNVQGALAIALDLAIKPEAKDLPGYTGVRALGIHTVENNPNPKPKQQQLKVS